MSCRVSRSRWLTHTPLSGSGRSRGRWPLGVGRGRSVVVGEGWEQKVSREKKLNGVNTQYIDIPKIQGVKRTETLCINGIFTMKLYSQKDLIRQQVRIASCLLNICSGIFAHVDNSIHPSKRVMEGGISESGCERSLQVEGIRWDRIRIP
jgi:hypothetical protein